MKKIEVVTSVRGFGKRLVKSNGIRHHKDFFPNQFLEDIIYMLTGRWPIPDAI